MGKVCIDIQYGKSTYDLVHLDSRLFQQCNLDVILKITAVNPRRLEEYQVVQGYDNRAMFRFNLLPAKYSDQGMCVCVRACTHSFHRHAFNPCTSASKFSYVPITQRLQHCALGFGSESYLCLGNFSLESHYRLIPGVPIKLSEALKKIT